MEIVLKLLFQCACLIPLVSDEKSLLSSDIQVGFFFFRFMISCHRTLGQEITSVVITATQSAMVQFNLHPQSPAEAVCVPQLSVYRTGKKCPVHHPRVKPTQKVKNIPGYVCNVILFYFNK